MNRLYSDLEQLKLLAKIKLSENTEGFFNQFKSTGSNMYGSMGIGSENSYINGETVFRLPQFNMRRVLKIAMGDFHTLVLANGCNCVDPIRDHCEGPEVCNGGSNLYAWGFNFHGQCDGVPSDQPTLVPKIVPWFWVNRKHVE